MRKYCIGVDLGGTFIKFALLDEDRRASGTFQLPTPAGRGSAGVVEQMVRGARQLMSDHGLRADDVHGVGIGAPGPLDLDNGVVIAMPNVPGMENVPLRDL
ncbi:MAG TPA: ROK family protein, partial [Phycisphaerae bacterium]|nr:ROK family protein [Phycisphaerae bacterium]